MALMALMGLNSSAGVERPSKLRKRLVMKHPSDSEE